MDIDGNNHRVLVFKTVSTESIPLYDTSLWDVSFSLAAGELLLIRMEPGRFRLPLADLAAGIVEPGTGAVEFLGRNWFELSPDEAAAQRGKIGRLFEEQGWVGHLDVGENITLAQRHHSSRPIAEIENEAINLARFFGLPGLPRSTVSALRREDLYRSAFIRAFLAKPALIILERPTRTLFPGIMPPLINAIQAARNRGSAVIWTTSEAAVWNEAGIRATLKCTMFGARMSVAGEDQ
jgi:phospholipid/cholesterol/gamma-HCH transport system ATP-binding protein